jgi:O-antigen ligase
MLSKKIDNESYFVLCIGLLVFALPLSNFLISVSQIGLLLCWLLLPGFKNRIKSLTKNKYIWIFTSLYILHIVGLLWASDLKFGLNDLRIKLPLLALPLVLGSIEPLQQKNTYLIIKLFIASVCVSTLISLVVLFGITGKEITDVRQISILISHIRLSLLICLAIFFLAYFLFFKNYNSKIQYGLIVFLILYLIYFLFLLSSINGLFVLFALSFCILVWFLFTKSSYIWKFVISFTLLIAALLTISAFKNIKMEYFSLHEKDSTPKNIHTKNGRNYTIEGDASKTENGYHVAWYHCKAEYEKEWNSRSKIHIDSLDLKKQYIRFTLHRYLTSRGLKKDSLGIWSLNKSDIENIENGITNYKYNLSYGIKNRMYQVFYEVEEIQKGSKPQGHSIGMRFYLWKAGLNIWKNNFWFGVGQGDIDQEFKKFHASQKDKMPETFWIRTHNQFLSIAIAFGVIGLVGFLFTLFYPLLCERKTLHFFYFVFLGIILLSFLGEDTLETSVGATMFAFFNSFLFFNFRKKRSYYS